MRTSKKQSFLNRHVVPFLVWLIYWVFTRTYRIKIEGKNHVTAAETAQNGSYCIVVWHCNVLMAIRAHEGQGVVPIVSQSGDGELATKMSEKLGYRPVRGSSHKGGKQALDAMVDLCQQGAKCAITVDGPKGPRHKVKAGAINLSSRAQVPLLPIAATAKSYWRLKSWDKFLLPKPFSKVTICYGKPIQIPADLSLEELTYWRDQVGEVLLQLEKDFAYDKESESENFNH